MVFPKNPAIWISLIGALLALAIGFGLKITGVQSELIMSVAAILIPILVGIFTKSQVYPEESVKVALRQEPGTTIKELDRVLEKQK